jgi:nucleolar GTP-binding protein
VQISKVAADAGAFITSLSNRSEEGVMAVRNAACDALMNVRATTKKASARLAEVAHRLTPTMPKPRDGRARPAHIPDSVVVSKAAEAEDDGEDPSAEPEAMASSSSSSSSAHIKELEVEIERAQGGPGVYRADWSKNYLLDDETWKRDVMPELMNGRNIADFVDKDILSRLGELETEEAVLLAQYSREKGEEEAEEASKTPLERAEEIAEKALAEEVRSARGRKVLQGKLKRANNAAPMPRTVPGRAVSRSAVVEALEERGMDPEAAKAVAARARPAKRGRSTSRRPEGEEDDVDTGVRASSSSAKRVRSRSIVRGVEAPEEGEGYRDLRMKSDAVKAARRAQKKMQKESRRGEGDRFIGDMMPKFLYSGKRGIGKTDWR